MSKFLSGRIKELLLGVVGRTEDKTVLQTTGTVGIGTTNSVDYTLYVNGSTNIDGGLTVGSASTFVGVSTFKDDVYIDNELYVSGVNVSGSVTIDEDINARNLNLTGIATVAGLTDLNGDFNVAGVSTFQDRAIFDSTNSIQIPVGTEAQKDAVGVAVTGQVRFNTTNQQFEGFGVGNNWGSLGGVKDVDGDTEIKAELSAGSDEDILYFYNGGYTSATISSEAFTVNVPISLGYNLEVTGIATVSGDFDVDGDTKLDNLNVSGVSTFSGTVDIDGDIDIDGHIDLDNVSISGVTTVTNTTDNTLGDADTGAVQIDGGLGVNKNVTVGAGLSVVSGFNVAGVSTFQDDIHLGDGDKINLGDNDDFQIFHHSNGTGIIQNAGSGQLQIRSDEIRLLNQATDEDYAFFRNDGAVELYYDNSKKFETTGAGVTVTGTTFSNQLNVSGLSTFSGLVDINDGGQANTFKVEDLTSGRVVLAGTGGELEDSANLTYDGNQFNVVGHTELDDVNVSGIATITSLDVQTNFDVYDSVATFHNNVHIDGNLSIGGTTTALQARDLQILDKDIILGVTTDAFGNDISTDITANHAGVAVASTEGSPLVDLFIAGLEELPTTYKKIMWFKEGSFSGLGTDAWLFNYAVGIGSTQFPSGTRLAVSETQITDDTLTTPNISVTNDLTIGGNITGTGDLTLTDTDSGSSAGPELKLYRNSSSPADADYLGQIKFAGESDTGVERNYAKITGKILDASNGTEDGIIEIAHIKAGSQNISARFRSDSLQLLNDTNFSVAGDSTFTGDVDANANVDIQGTLDVDGHTELDNVSVAGVSTFTGAIDADGDLDVDGHTNLDNVDIAGVTTTSGLLDINAGGQANTFKVEDLTDNRVVIAGTGGELEDDANLTFNGSTLSVGVDLDVDGHTELDNVNVSGLSTFQNNIHLLDDDRLQIGGSVGTVDGLEIYHDGSNSYIADTGTGAMQVSASAIIVRSNVGENMAQLYSNGAVKLFHNNAQKFETTGYGVTVFGTTETQQLNVSGIATVNHIDANSISPDGSDTGASGYVPVADGAGGWNWLNVSSASSANTILNGFTVNEEGVVVGTAGSITTLDFRGGNVLVSADPQPNGIATITFSPNPVFDTLNVTGVSTFGNALDINNGVDISGDISIADKIIHTGDQNTAIRFPANDTFTVETAGQERIRVDSSGRLGIGTVSPSQMLEIYGSTPTIELTDSDTGVIHRINANSGAGIFYFDNDINNVGSDGSFVFRHGHLSGGGSVLTISSVGTLTLGSNSGTIRRSGDTDTYMNFTGSDAIRFVTANSERLEINNSGIDVTGHTETDTLQVSGIATFGNAVSAGGTTGTNGQYLESTGVGVTWASFPTLRTTQTSSAVNGQTTFNFTYNVNFLDVFINGVKLTSSEYTASNGTSVVLATPAFENDTVEFHSYNTTSTGAAGGGASNLNGLSDVTISSLADDHILQYNSSTNVFENVAAPYATTASVGLATAGLASEVFVGLATAGLASEAFVGLSTAGLTNEAFVGLATAGLTNEAFVGLSTVGLLTATGDASNLTGLTGASANTYGNSTAVPQIVVDANGRITGITNVLISGGGGGGTSIIVNDSQSLVGTAGTIDFGTGLSVSPVSTGIVTVTVNGSEVDAGSLGGSALTALQKNDADTDLVMNNQILHFGAANTRSRIRWSGTTSLWDLVDGDLKFRDDTTDRFTFERTTGNFTATGSVSASSFSGDGSGLTGISTNVVSTWNITADGGSNNYIFEGPGLDGAQNDPTIYLLRGQTYVFDNNSGGHPLQIQYEGGNTGGTQYNDGIQNNNVSGAELFWNVQNDAPDVLYYQCTSHVNMWGKIIILGESKTEGSWTAAAGVLNNIDTITGIANNNFKAAEYMVHISNGGNMQTQKVLVMQDGTTASSTEYAIIYDNSLLVSIGASVHGGNFYLNATPETGITGITTFRFTRQTIR